MNNTQTKTCYLCNHEDTLENGVQWGSYFYCKNCFKQQKCNVSPYHSPSIPTKLKYTDGEDEDALFFGIELETTKGQNDSFYNSNHVETLYYIRKNFKELDLNFETDSSIGNGFEIVTQPMTYKFIKENEEKFKTILEYLKDNGYYSHNKGKCGLHIHVSKNALGENNEDIQKTIEKLMLFVETYRPSVERFSRRKHKEYSRYNAYTIPNHKDNYGNESCFKTEDYYKSGRLLYELNKHDCVGHSSVINDSTSTGKTVEFRMFRGTLKFETFMATIEFVNNLVNVCKENMASKINWSKVINYGGEYIKEYNDSLDLDELQFGNEYLRDYTPQLNDIIKKYEDNTKKILDNYKKSLNTIEESIRLLLNEPIDFNTDVKIVRDTLLFRSKIYSQLVLSTTIDENNESNYTLYFKLRKMNYSYTETCKNCLNGIKNTLSSYTTYRLNDETIENVKKVIKVINDRIEEIENNNTNESER